MFKNLNVYIIYKRLQAFVFNPNLGLKEQKDIIFMRNLELYLKLVYNDLDYTLKQDILTALSELRLVQDENKNERIEIINSIIRNINMSKTDNDHIFYKLELYNRFKDFKYLEQDIDDEMMEGINSFIFLDYLILISHIDLTTDDEFENEYLKQLIGNIYYYNSIEILINECPNILKNNKFIKRFKKIHELNKSINLELDKYDLKVVEKIFRKN